MKMKEGIVIVGNMEKVLTTTLKMMESRKITIRPILNSRRKLWKEILKMK